MCGLYGHGASDADDSHYAYGISRNSHPRVVIDCGVPRCTVSLKDKDGKILASSTNEFWGSLALVYAADLNGDKKQDFVAWVWSNGCGLGGMIYAGVFFLSTETGYAARTITCYCPAPEDFVDINRDGRPEFLHTMCVFGGPDTAKDGKVHNYWVCNLLRFEGADLVSANDLDSRFPAWIYYSLKPNHKNTDLLTGEQRMRLWRKAWEQDVLPDQAGQPADLKRLVTALEREQARTVPKTAKTPSQKAPARPSSRSDARR